MSRCRRGVWGAEKLVGKLKDFIAKVKAYFDGLTTNTKAEAALLKEMRDGGLHYLERIVEAYDKAATAAVESYQGAETRSEGGENQYMARGKYWRPQLKRAEWELLERRMNAEIKSGENFLDEATKWVYADEKGVQVFALYGIGDGTDATPLYAVGGKTASAKAKMLMDYIREEQNYDGDRKALDALLKGYGHFEGNGRSNLSNRRGGRTTAGRNAALHGGPSGSNGRRAAERSSENQRGVKDQFSIREIKGEDGTDYGKGVYLDSTLLEGMTDAERTEMMRERVKELGGQTITTYDPNGEAVDIRIATPNEYFRNKNGRKISVTEDLARKNRGVKIKQESVVLADELIATSRYKDRAKAKYPHGWLDNNGKNDWQYWTTYIQDKNNTVWKATLNVAESANGVKYLYDIDPIKKVGQSVKSDTSTTSVGQSVKSDTSTTGDIVAQNQTESQAQIRSSTISDRDVLRIAAQMAKNSESMLDIKKNHPASSLFRAYNSVPAASAEWLYWQYNLCWAECQHQGLAFFLRGSVNRFSVNFFSIEVITASLSFFRTIQVCCVDIEIKTDFTAHIWRTRILKYTKSLSIADQFPGFNIISVLFLTEFLCIFFDKCNSIFDDISRIHSDSTPLEHFFSMPCREAATLPDCTCARTMNFNPCAP